MNIQYNNLDALKNRINIVNFDEQYQNVIKNIDDLFIKNSDCFPLLISITGSTSYGLDLEASDLDVKGIYFQSIDSILSELNIGTATPCKYKNQIGNGVKIGNKIKEDIVFYEFGRILELLEDNNPNCLELLSTPDECVIWKHPLWDNIVKELKDNGILTKKCYHTFYSYANQQIKKATGLNKKINNPIEQKRKTPIDFCHVLFDDDSTMELRSFLEKNKLDQRMCGLSKISHMRDLYSVYYDIESSKSFSKFEDSEKREIFRREKRKSGENMGFGYKGIIKENENNEEVSNDLRLSSIPKEEKRIAIISYNKDGYLTYCKDWREYWGVNGWYLMRNEERFKDNTSSNQNYDGKNLSHCLRLLYMAKEISEGKGIIVHRNEQQRNELLEVKKGKWLYEDIMNKCQELTNGLEENYKNSDLPEIVSREFLIKTLLKYRKLFYNI